MSSDKNLHRLFSEQGQSPWLDNLKRSWIHNGELQNWIDRGVRGLTSNPSIFQKAISGSDSYDEQFGQLIADGKSIEESYWELVIQDIEDALALLRPLYDSSDGLDGYVSVEVSPNLANDTDGTLAAATDLNARIDEPNVYIKIPGTAAGLPAIEQATAQGINVNVTLLFSIDRYAEVMEAYISGLEQHEGDLSRISSVASFFISRVETEVDNRLTEIGSEEALALRGRAAVANGVMAYQLFTRTFAGERWEKLVARGAKPQRPLWASTSTKNDDYPDTLYIDALIGPDSVNTIPDKTLAAFEDHGTVARTIDADVDQARAALAAIDAVGVDLADVAQKLEDAGVASFAAAFDSLLDTLKERAADFS